MKLMKNAKKVLKQILKRMETYFDRSYEQSYCIVRDWFLSAAQPTDQGEESVVLLLLLVVVGGGPFFSLPCAFFLGVKRQKTLSKKG